MTTHRFTRVVPADAKGASVGSGNTVVEGPFTEQAWERREGSGALAKLATYIIDHRGETPATPCPLVAGVEECRFLCKVAAKGSGGNESLTLDLEICLCIGVAC